MFIPIRTDRAPRYTPWMTQLLILANILVYLYGFLQAGGDEEKLYRFIESGMLFPNDPTFLTLISYQFLHDTSGISHILFNMLFLWVFGSAVEGRLKHFGFLAFYLAGGVFAGIGHMMFSQSPVIGASGSVSAVTGMYLALFPRSRVQLLCFFIIIGIFYIPSMWFIGFYFALDLFRAISGARTGVAYMAHMAGSVFGFGIGLGLLATGILARTEFDAFFLLKQWRRRSQFRSVSNQSRGGVWDTPNRKPTNTRRPAKPGRPPQPLSKRTEDPKHAEYRNELSEFIRQRDLASAARRYEELLREDTIVFYCGDNGTPSSGNSFCATC